MSVNKIIRERRAELHLSVTKLAKACGVSRAAVQQWEKEGGRAPNRANQPAVAAALQLTVSELMGTAGEMTRVVAELSPRAIEVARMFDRITDPVLQRIAYATMAAQSSLGGTPPRLTIEEVEPVKPTKRALTHKT